MGRILCFLGLHDWGRQECIRGGTVTNSIIVALLGSVFNPATCERQCMRCGQRKSFVYDSRRG